MTIAKTQLRLPEYLRDWVKKRGLTRNRTMNGEIVQILQEAKAKEDRENKKAPES